MNKKENMDNMYTNYFQHEKRRIEKRKQKRNQKTAFKHYDKKILRQPILTRILAETLGSFILVFSTIFAFSLLSVLSFNLSLDFGAIAIVVGVAFLIAYLLTCDISGGFINPIITITMVFLRKISIKDALLYVFGEFLGAVVACLVALNVLPAIQDYGVSPQTWITYAGNGFGDLQPLNMITSAFYGANYPMASALVPAIIIEILCSALFIAIFIKVSNERFTKVTKGAIMGIALSLLTSLSIQISSAGLNPIKSLAIALFAQDWSNVNGGLITQVWVYVLFPIVGALLAVLFYYAFNGKNRRAYAHETDENDIRIENNIQVKSPRGSKNSKNSNGAYKKSTKNKE